MSDAPANTLYCANHPQVATALRCNKCNKPICTRCAVRTPVGYRCPECVRGQQQVFETAQWYDYVVAAVLAAPLGFLGALLLGFLGWFIIFLAPVAGGIAAEVVRVAVRKRRSRYLPLVAAGAFALGSLLVVVAPWLLVVLAVLQGASTSALGGRMLFSSLLPVIYTVLATSTLYMRLRGIAV